MGRGRERRTLKVLAFAAALTAAGVALFSGASTAAGPPVVDIAIPWLALAAAFAVAEACAVHLEFRGDAQTFSLSELPLVVALLCASPADVLAARVLGGLVVIVLLNRQAPIKIAFNTALMVFWASLASWIYHHLAAWSALPTPRSWIAAFVAVVAVTITDAIVIALVVRLSGGRTDTGTTRMFIVVGAMAAAATTSVAILAVVSIADTPQAAVLVTIVAGVLYGAYRAYTGSEQRYKKLQQLYEFTQILNRSPELGSAARAILVEAAELLRGERAELYLRQGDGPAIVRIALNAGAEVETGTIVASEVPFVSEVLASGQATLVPRRPREDAQRELLCAAGARDIVVLPLVQGGTVTGALAVLDRMGDVSTFDHEDVKVLATFATHASMSLENAKLIDELRQEAADREHQALHDSLTGLPNRSRLYRATAEALERAEEATGRVALLLMDLDRFKEVNDTLGHHHGDVLLQQIAARVTEVAPRNATVARLGGDEFAILVPAVASVEAALEVARTLESVFQKPFLIEGLELSTLGSIGVAVSPEHGTATDVLMQHADVAMYAAKDGEGSVELYRSEQNEHSAHRLAVAGALRHAIEVRGLSIAYQPKAVVATGEVIGVEALARWHHSEFGTIAPDEFIPLAEHVGLIRPLTMLILEDALAQLRRWRDSGIDIGMAVNLSARNLVDGSLPRDVAALLRHHRIEPAKLTLEITETEIMRDPERAMAVIRRLRETGVHLSIDDFGTGHSSLAYLRHLPVDEIKIDKSFVFHLGENETDAAIVRSIVDLAGSRQLRVVAEGVEDRVTWERLDELGCDIAQGYYLSRPLPAAELTPWLRAQLGRPAAPAPATV